MKFWDSSAAGTRTGNAKNSKPAAAFGADFDSDLEADAPINTIPGFDFDARWGFETGMNVAHALIQLFSGQCCAVPPIYIYIYTSNPQSQLVSKCVPCFNVFYFQHHLFFPSSIYL